jgi:hypothetical protein
VRLGENAFVLVGDYTIPDDRIIELDEAEAAALLRNRNHRDVVEVLGWVEEGRQEERPSA